MAKFIVEKVSLAEGRVPSLEADNEFEAKELALMMIADGTIELDVEVQED